MTNTDVMSEEDVRAAMAVWEKYQQTHDVTPLKGQAVGIDPHTGEVFFGAFASDIWRRLEAEGRFRILLYTRVGRPAYGRFRHGRRLS
jgi:hypothetical protein